MIVFEETIENSPAKTNESEIRLHARSVSRGVAIGKVVCLHGRKRQFYRLALKESQVEREVRRFQAAVRLAKRHLNKSSSQKNDLTAVKKLNVFEAHLLILEDRALIGKIEEHIRKRKVNAEWAVKVVIDSYVAQYKSLADEYFRERYIDLEDIGERILTALGGGQKATCR